jgi:ribonucleoside-diphosphate reductase alpha chain
MEEHDKGAKAMKSGGSTRAAAKMVVLDMDHPDILKTKDGRPGFISCKAVEETRAHDLIEKCGYSAAYDDPNSAYKWVSYQNANHSVSVPDAFMEAVVNDSTWDTHDRLTGKVIHTYKARELWNEIAKAAWICGDPGVQFTDTINKWHTTPHAGRIRSSNPCSEFLDVDDTACNLCAINLTKFFDVGPGGKLEFCFERFEQSVRVFSTCQMAIVDKAEYPTEKIGANSLRLRPIGTNYGDLGALLMRMGLSYDSDAGRAVAARLASLMTGLVYKTAATLASRVGPFQDFEQNREEMLNIMEMHRKADSDILSRWNLFKDPLGTGVGSASDHSGKVWNDVMDLGAKYGFYVHQATLQAPLGTISFLMGMDTTGIEPAFSLVSYKSLVGGGFMKIVNAAVPGALRNLGYNHATEVAICDYLANNGYIEGAPGLKDDHLCIFDCAMPTGPSGRYLSPMAHIKMMAAIQPLITCAQSKTVNLPQSVTPQEIADTYLEAWKLGVKCIALYRDGCKLSQPLATKERSDTQSGTDMKAEATMTQPSRRHMPEDINAHRHRFEIDNHKGYVLMGEYPDGTLGEVFLKLGKSGSTMSGLVDGFTQLLSIALQYGVPLDKIIRSFVNTKFEPSGWTGNPRIRHAGSLFDYLFKLLDLRYFGGVNSGLAQLAEGEPGAHVSDSSPPDSNSEGPRPMHMDAPPCRNCGAMTHRNGTCYLCTSCGTSSGCS